ncbi:MAG: VCBS repeat-containing protein [Nitrospinota bacterium]|nr:VCBS repeat-containing protein [Nitrospinota bacterium]
MRLTSYRLLKLFLPFIILLMVLNRDAPAGERSPGIERMVSQIETLFPVLEGYVLSVKGDRVAIDLKRGQAVSPGQTLKLIRYGETITHPVTKAIVGREENDLGQIKVLEVRKDYSIAQIITPGAQAQKGDGVRSAFKKLKLLVAPVQSDDEATGDVQALRGEIETQVNRNLRFEVPAFDVGVWMLENDIALPALARQENLARLRTQVASDAVLFTQVQSIKGKTVLNYRLVSSSDGSELKQARIMIESLPAVAQAPAKEQEVQSDFRQEEKGLLNYVGKQDFDFELVDFDTGDLSGNGDKEFVIIDDHRVLIYKYQNNQFKKVGQVTLPEGNNKFLSVDVADINGNGRDEVFVTNSQGDALSSFVLEVVPGKKGLTRIWENVNRYFRVLRDFDGPPMLISQTPGYEKPFKDGIQIIHHKNGGYQVESELSLPVGDYRDMVLYGLAQGSITPSKSKETIILDKNYHLRVYSPGGRLLVSSNEYFGHDPRIIEVGLKDQVAGTFIDSPDTPQPVRFKGRLQLIQHNARKYLFVPRNHRTGSFLSKLVIVKNSSLVILGITPEGLEKAYETKKQRGYLAAFQVVESAGKKPRQVHVASVADHGGFLGDKMISTIYTYDWLK